MNEPNSGAQASRRKFRLWVAATSTLGFGVWWVASILLHTALFGVLTVVSPEKQTELATMENSATPIAPEEFTMTISPDRVEEVVEEIRDRKGQEFQAQVEELLEIQKELEAANIAKVQQYNELMKSEAALAPDAVKKAAQEALAAQDEAIAAQEQAKTALSKLGEAQAAVSAVPSTEDHITAKPNADAAKADVEKAQAAASAAQNKAMTAQVKIEQQLDVFGQAANEVLNIHQVNSALQNQATKLQKDANNAAQAVDKLRAKEDALRVKTLADKARADAEQKRQVEEEAKIAELQAAGNPKARELTQLLAKQPKTKLSAERAVQAAKDDAIKVAELAPAIDAALKQAQQTEAQAQQAQAQAKEALARSAERLEQAVAKASERAAVPVPAQPETSPATSRNLAELYNQALQAEDTLTNTYKQVRAAELAAIRKLPMAQALALTEVAKPVRNTVDTKILSENIRDVQGVQKQEKAINAASAELDSMVSLARRMKELALPEIGANVTVGDLKNQADHSDRMEQLAVQSEGARAKDLSGEMGDAAMKDRDGAGVGDDAEAARLAKSNEPPSYLFAAPKDLKPIPGRTIGDVQSTPSGRNASWMFVDSWYLIGPWPNPGRKNLNTKFPPETVVDLNATYTGGRRYGKPMPVSWRFYQAPAFAAPGPFQSAEQTGQIIPPGLGEYEIYYAYTELWSDTARDLWVAIGSDDQSKIWINDDMIWKSGDELKGWVPNEGLRKVHFRKGINRILCRYENGHMKGCFSFLISLKTTVAAPIQTNVKAGR